MPSPEPGKYFHAGLKSCLAAAVLCAWSMPAWVNADELQIEIRGIEDPLLSNVRTSLDSSSISNTSRLSERRVQRLADQVEIDAKNSLKPFGYYHAVTQRTITDLGEGTWQLKLDITAGAPVRVESAEISISGEGASLEELRDWRKEWPLRKGSVLNQVRWEEQKATALELAERHGYLLAEFTTRSIKADLDQNTAVLELHLATGPQAVMGSVRYEQDVVRTEILEGLPRFQPGQAYDAWLLEKFRFDVWKTGYFSTVEIIEERRLEETPPLVNLVVKATEKNRDTYQGSIGFGTDTGIRAQLLWNRSLFSSRGDTLDMGLGWQQTNEEYSFRSNYRLPRRTHARQFWTADLFIRKENQDLEVKINDNDNEVVKLTNGNAIDYSVKAGLLHIRDIEGGYEQINETWYGQYVLETNDFNLDDFIVPGDESDVGIDDLERSETSLSLGVNWDWPAVRGSGFQTLGHRERAWIFHANEAWGSNREFTQAYVSSNWHRMLGDRFKLLVRGEIGYSDADVNELLIEYEGDQAMISVTELPNLYRFKAGGSRSVRGYSFESLSNNAVGSNNIITASAEVEMLFLDNWSAAAFVDTGNAFNDWNKMDLKTGAGLGIRWYSIAGAIRLDIAQPLDFDGESWRVHFTIGTPLL